MKVGDTVYLKSGSPKLKVEAVTENRALVMWLGEEGEEVMESFDVAALTADESAWNGH